MANRRSRCIGSVAGDGVVEQVRLANLVRATEIDRVVEDLHTESDVDAHRPRWHSAVYARGCSLACRARFYSVASSARPRESLTLLSDATTPAAATRVTRTFEVGAQINTRMSFTDVAYADGHEYQVSEKASIWHRFGSCIANGMRIR